MKRAHSSHFKLKQDVRFGKEVSFSVKQVSQTTVKNTHRSAPSHLEGEICRRDLIQLPSHIVGEAMQAGK